MGFDQTLNSILKVVINLPVCRCQRTSRGIKCAPRRLGFRSFLPQSKLKIGRFAFLRALPRKVQGDWRRRQPVVGVAGFEPATLRLSSACSNQLSYTPG